MAGGITQNSVSYGKKRSGRLFEPQEAFLAKVTDTFALYPMAGFAKWVRRLVLLPQCLRTLLVAADRCFHAELLARRLAIVVEGVFKMELLLGRLIEFLISPVRSVVEHVRGVPCYRAGFVAGVAGALVVGWISNELLYLWNRVLQFFGPTLKPAADVGPSPMNRLMEALRSFALLIIVVVLLALVAKLASAGTG